MTDAERIALAKKWYDLPIGNEWTVIVHAYWDLLDESIYEPDTPAPMDLLLRVGMVSEQRNLFDLLVQRVLENKLLGATE
jgi:hypothetical protein